MRLALALLLMTSLAAADPRSDLASPDQAKRDAAAATIAKTWKAPAKATWDKLLASIKPGEPQASVVAKLPKGHVLGVGHAGGGSAMQMYHLDEIWALQVYFNDRNKPWTVLSHNVLESARHVWVDPPAKFTGTWITYFPNGQKSHQIDYKAGVYDGLFITFDRTGKETSREKYVAGNTP